MPRLRNQRRRAAESRWWCPCDHPPAPRHRRAASRHPPRHARRPGPRRGCGNLRAGPVTRWPGCSNRPGFLISRWISSPGRARWQRRTGSGGSICASRPSPARASQRETAGRAGPSLAAIAAPVIRRLRRRCRICATVAPASGPETRAGALARFESAAAPPARNRASHLRRVRTETPKAEATSIAVWPAPARATLVLDCNLSGAHSGAGCSSNRAPSRSLAIAA